MFYINSLKTHVKLSKVIIHQIRAKYEHYKEQTQPKCDSIVRKYPWNKVAKQKKSLIEEPSIFR